MPWGHKYLKLACLPFHHGCAFRQTIPKFDDSVKRHFKTSPSIRAVSPPRHAEKNTKAVSHRGHLPQPH